MRARAHTHAREQEDQLRLELSSSESAVGDATAAAFLTQTSKSWRKKNEKTHRKALPSLVRLNYHQYYCKKNKK